MSDVRKFDEVRDTVRAQERFLDLAGDVGPSAALETMISELSEMNAANGGDPEKLAVLCAMLLFPVWSQVSTPGGLK